MGPMSVHSLFSNGVDPLAGIVWTAREVTLQGAERKVITVMAPDHWFMTAVAVFASHYLRVVNGVRETHFGEAINRLAETVSGWALADGYVDAESAAVLRNELAYMLVYQMWSPNSPVWYNVGTVARPQISACYIQHLSDAMDGDDGIIALQSAETRLFRRGSGTGTNHSNLRPEGYPISVGGTASGPVSFMRGFDATAGAIKSGGSTRRAAKMVILNDDHPDIEKYVDSKVDVEQMAWDLVDAGHSSDYNGKMYANLALQNANHSVGVSDAFMDAVATDGLWTLQWGGVPARTIRARELWDRIIRAAHYCGDPGLQFRDTINHWHTSPSGGAIHGSNPCAEFVYIDDSACNLAAHNLRQYQRHAAHPYARRAWNSDPSMVNTIDVQALGHGVEISILVQDVLVSRASYPTPAIEINSLKYRPLGMGYANLGALLMSLGLGYDTDAGRAYAGAITSFIGAEAYRVSQQLARTKGVSFAQNAADGANMRRVLSQHAQAAQRLAEQASFVASQKDAPPALTGYTGMVATDAAALATQAHGVWVKVMNADVLPRNGQVTLLAPTGTTGLAMGCDTTGIEPDYALVKHKRLAGGGYLKIVNQTVKDALMTLGYTHAQIGVIVAYVERTEKIEGAPELDPQHLPVFDCAGRCAEMTDAPGERYLVPHAHLRMMATVQPFLSGAISKCVVGETILTTAQGLMRIASLHPGTVADSFSPLAMKVPQPDGTLADAESFYYGGVRSVWRVVLSDGRRIEGTAPHRLRVCTPTGLAWKTIPDLENGDFIAISQGAECWGTNRTIPPVLVSEPYGSGHKNFKCPVELTAALGLFLGMLTADGHVIQSNYTVGLTKNCPEVLATFGKLLYDLFGLPHHISTDERNGVTSVRVGSKALCEWLSGIGFTKEIVPDIILTAPRDVVCGYLSGLYLDGYITRTGDVAISQKHGGLLRDVQALWDNMGVSTYFTDNEVNGVVYPVLHAYASSRPQMCREIAWLEPHKIALAVTFANSVYTDRSPFPMRRDALMEEIRAAKLTQTFRECLDKRTHTLTKRAFFAAAAAVGMPIPEEERRCVYSSVVSVEYVGEREVFDISVPSTETFIANGIVNHNTVNTPFETSIEEIGQLYSEAWKLGLKCVAIYRDGSKANQPLCGARPPRFNHAHPHVVKTRDAVAEALGLPAGQSLDELRAAIDALRAENTALKAPRPTRRKLPAERQSLCKSFSVGSHEGYVHVGLYPEGTAGEIFVRMSKMGSTVSGLLDAWATMFSVALQYGAPLEVLCEKGTGSLFQPSGFTGDELRSASSPVDYVSRWLMSHSEFMASETSEAAHGEAAPSSDSGFKFNDGTTYGDGKRWGEGKLRVNHPQRGSSLTEGPACQERGCGGVTRRSGACYVCESCGSTSGCG